MDRVVLETKATSTVTDEGIFVAVAAAYSVDRVNDRIIPGAFEKTIKAWQDSGKNIPLHWDHQGEPEDIIGVVDPSTMRETKDGLEVTGQVDLENSAKGREAWRAIKSGSMSLSFGYVATKQEKAADGVNDLQELDLFEISVVPGPANADTRFLSLKSVKHESLSAEDCVKVMLKDTEEYLRRFGADDQLGKTVEQAFRQFRLGQKLISQGAAKDKVESKVQWTPTYIKSLPDSSFLYVEPEGERQFPYRDADGNVDLPQLEKARDRIPHSELPQSLKDRLTSEAERILSRSAGKATPEVEDRPNEEPLPAKFARQDPLADMTDDLWLATATGNAGGSHADAERASP